ncbi:MAG: hypothetical protein LC737_06930, partial [Chloroflexi bacterium]|nr:hypothetical protein [Chloroflexota bacterium]
VWTFVLEFLVLPHGVMLALMNGNNMWQMFLLGFLGIFFITQMFGLPFSTRLRWLLFAAFVALNGLIYAVYFGSWATAPRDVLAIPLIEYLSIGVLYGLFLFGFMLMRLVRKVGDPAAV